ncbi:MAG: cytochrome c [Gammaproteobacteria bacterium]|nr:cytochrome c [Gammaproteobacteria bacterium]
MSILIQFVTSMLLITMSMATTPVMASAGEELYIIKCACCHNDESTVRIGQSKIKKALTDDKIRAHYFKLSDSETKLLVDYLTEDKD